MTTTNTNTSTIEQDLAPVGTWLKSLATSQKKTMRQIASDTKLSVNSVKVVFSGETGNVSTYDIVARYLGSSFIRAVMAAHSPTVTPTATSQVTATIV